MRLEAIVAADTGVWLVEGSRCRQSERAKNMLSKNIIIRMTLTLKRDNKILVEKFRKF